MKFPEKRLLNNLLNWIVSWNEWMNESYIEWIFSSFDKSYFGCFLGTFGAFFRFAVLIILKQRIIILDTEESNSRHVDLKNNRAARIVAALQPGCEEMEREWGNEEEMERKWGNGERLTLYISSFSLYFLPLSPFPPSLSISYIKMHHILLQNVKYGTFVANVTKISTYALWGNNSGSNLLRGSSAIRAGLICSKHCKLKRKWKARRWRVRKWGARKLKISPD